MNTYGKWFVHLLNYMLLSLRPIAKLPKHDGYVVLWVVATGVFQLIGELLGEQIM